MSKTPSLMRKQALQRLEQWCGHGDWTGDAPKCSCAQSRGVAECSTSPSPGASSRALWDWPPSAQRPGRWEFGGGGTHRVCADQWRKRCGPSHLQSWAGSAGGGEIGVAGKNCLELARGMVEDAGQQTPNMMCIVTGNWSRPRPAGVRSPARPRGLRNSRMQRLYARAGRVVEE